ncbi:MAG: TonB-dependent receptor [Pseudomonadota bacterium]|nr:TonB-dependent receptor [Pseudomonadota bacterium]
MEKCNRPILQTLYTLAYVCLSTGSALADVERFSMNEVVITDTRLTSGLPGASTITVTSEQIENSPYQTLAEILSTQPGIQFRSLYSDPTGSKDVVDVRGFGATAESNTLILLDGRRQNDMEIEKSFLANIPLESIERIEIIKGSAGSVLYGDGAIGGVINIITKHPAKSDRANIKIAAGSFSTKKTNISVAQVKDNFSISLHGQITDTDGYRQNGNLLNQNIINDFRYTGKKLKAYLNIKGDQRKMGMPGGLSTNQVVNGRPVGLYYHDRNAATEIMDKSSSSSTELTLGGTHQLDKNFEIITDGGIRRTKNHFTDIDNAFGSHNNNRTYLDTWSLTPRLTGDFQFLGTPANTTLGLDWYYSDYRTVRGKSLDDKPHNEFDARQHTLGLYCQNIFSPRDLKGDISFGIRLHHLNFVGGDQLDLDAPDGDWRSQTETLEETSWAFSSEIGINHRLTNQSTIFGRAARGIRLPTIDERISSKDTGATTFKLKTQRSWDLEGGIKHHIGSINLQSSAYAMWIRNEIHLDARKDSFLGTNVNLHKTRRYGFENAIEYQLLKDFSINGNINYTRAQFQCCDINDGLKLDGNDLPLISKWTGNLYAKWQISEYTTMAVNTSFVGSRKFDNDQEEFHTKIPGYSTTDLKVRGSKEKFFWLFEINNLFDKEYYNYGVASSNRTKASTENIYPLAGRNFLLQAGYTY